MDVSSRDFAAHLSLFLRKAQAGETIVVTEEGRAIAELRPMTPSSSGSEESALLALTSSGLVSAPTRKRNGLTPPLHLAGPPISDALLEDRGDRF